MWNIIRMPHSTSIKYLGIRYRGNLVIYAASKLTSTSIYEEPKARWDALKQVIMDFHSQGESLFDLSGR